MALSDEILADPVRRRRLRGRLLALVRESGASAAFLVDERGTPFATTGHVEFRLPHPLAGLVGEGAADAILGALVGEPETEPSAVLVERLGARALLVLVFPRPHRRRPSIKAAVREIAKLL
jgi:hypothetical protein